MPVKKILIIRFSSIGDMVLTTPVIRNIKSQYPSVSIHYCTKEIYSEILAENPYIDKFHFYSNSIQSLAKELRAEKFDLIIDLHNNLRSNLLSILLGFVKRRSVRKLNLRKWLLVNFKVDTLPNVHIVDRYLYATRDILDKSDHLGLDYFIAEKDEVEPAWLPVGFQNEFVAVVIGGTHFTKRLPKNRLIELCDKINRPIILIGGEEEVETGNQVEAFFKRSTNSDHLEEQLKELGKKTIVFNGCGKFNFNQSASLIKQAKVVFSHDTGLMHVAAAFKKQIFSIWGSTVPKFGMYPYGTKFTIFENTQVSCRPCSKIGKNSCPKGHFNCMNKVNFDFYIP